MGIRNYNVVLKNYTYLSILNGLNILLPLLVIPYLTNVIGAAHFGVYAYVLVLVQNVSVITQFGFQFSATKKIAQNRDNRAFLNKYCSIVLSARFLVATVCVAVILALSHWMLDTEDRFFMFVTALGMVYGDVFIPTWLFQGMERMKYVTIVNTVSKVLFMLLTFVVVVRPMDYRYILLLNSLGFLAAALLSMILMRVQFGICLVRPTLKEVYKELRESLALFFSMVGIDLYRNVNVIILNFFVSDTATGVYALAEKVIKAVQSFITPISQALFPHVSLKIKTEGLKKSMSLVKKTSFLLLCVTVFAALVVYFCGDILVSFVGKDFRQIKPLLNLMYPVLVFGCLNFLLGFVGLVNIGQQRFFFCAVFISGTISLVLLACLVRTWGVQVAAFTMSMSEIILFFACAVRLWMLSSREERITHISDSQE